MATPDDILALAGQQQHILAALEAQQAQTLIDAWTQARTELAQRMEALWTQTFGSGIAPEPAAVIEWSQRTELLASLDARLDQLGITTQTLQGQAWSTGAQMGWSHAQAQLGLVLGDFGGAGAIGRSTFGRLDLLRHDLAMTAAINETRNLGNTLRAAVHQELIAGASQGEGIRQLRRRIDPLLGGATSAGGNRAELISRWSTIKGYNAAAEDSLADAATSIPGLQKQWITQRDERTCPNCLAHHGETIDTEDEFDKDRTFASSPQKVYGGVLDYPPLHPRCRCTIVAWHPRWQSFATKPPDVLQDEAQEAAQQAGFTTAPKPFTPPAKPPVGSLRRTRAGRRVIHASNIAQIPDSVREATIERYLGCQIAGGL